jgi:hypothetical protein
MLLRTGCETAARELQGSRGHFPKMRLFTQRLVRAYVSFNKASERIHSALYAFGNCHRRKMARLFQRHDEFRTCCDLVQRAWGRRKIEVELLANPIDFSPLSRIEPVLIVGAWHSLKAVRLRDGLALHAHLGRRAQDIWGVFFWSCFRITARALRFSSRYS